MVIQIFQLFLLVADSGQGFPVRHDFHIHTGINGKGELLLLIVKDFRRREVQFAHNGIDGEISDICRGILLLDFQIPLLFFNQTACRLDKVVIFYQRFLIQFFLRQIVFVVLICCSCLPVKVSNEITEIVLVQTADFKTA